MLTFRPFDHSDADFETIVALWNAHFPNFPASVEEMKYRESVREPDQFWGRVMVEEDGETIAMAFYGDPFEVDSPGEYIIHVQVHPDHERRGVGTAVYDHVVGTLAERDPAMLMSFACEEEPKHLRFLTSRGYESVMRQQDSRLVVADFDESSFADTVTRVDEAGVEITTARELDASRPGWRRELWELDWVLAQDEPHTAPPRKLTFEVYSRHHFDGPGYLPDALFVAIHEDRVVGRSALWRRLGSPDKLDTGMTGSARSHRRRGIATALKIRGIGFAAANGYTLIETSNEENNPMYTLNVSLGFRPIPAWLWLRKECRARS